MSEQEYADLDKLRRKAVLSAPLEPLTDLSYKAHVRAGRSLRTRMLASQKTAGNGRPEPAPYRWRGTPGWSPAAVAILPHEYQQARAEREEWAAEHAAVVARIRARLGASP